VRPLEGSLDFGCFAVILGSLNNSKERAAHTIPQAVPTIWRYLSEQLFVSHTKKKKKIRHGDEHTFWKLSQPAEEIPVGANCSAQLSYRSLE
jgi:hypothetical protein